MNHEELSGIDKALILGNAANTKLEYTAKPTLKDKKESRDLFKRAYKILENVIGLEEEDIYETGPRPDDAFTDTTEHEIHLPVVETPEEELLPAPVDFLRSWETWTEEERKEQFDIHIEALTSLHAEQNPDQEDPLDVVPFLEIFGENPLWAFRSVLFCLAQEPVLFTYPDAQDVGAWAEALMGEPADENTFDAKLAELEEAGVKEGGLKRKAWKKAEKAWRDSYLLAAPWTLEALLWRLAQSAITWDVPTPEEMDTPEVAHAVGEE